MKVQQAKIAIRNVAEVGRCGRHFCRNITIMFGMEKLEWCRYPTVKQFCRCLFICTEYTNMPDGQTEGQTDGQTPLDGIGHAYA